MENIKFTPTPCLKISQESPYDPQVKKIKRAQLEKVLLIKEKNEPNMKINGIEYEKSGAGSFLIKPIINRVQPKKDPNIRKIRSPKIAFNINDNIEKFRINLLKNIKLILDI